MCSACSLIRKAHEKAKAIGIGHYNILTGNITDQAKERMKICQNCKFNVLGVCQLCLCPVKAKTTVPEEECPKGYWDD